MQSGWPTAQPSWPAAPPNGPEAPPSRPGAQANWPVTPNAPRLEVDAQQPPVGGPDQRTAQMGATPAVFEEPANPPERTTHMFGAIPGAHGPGLVEPPSAANQQVWTGPETPNPINEATVAHPVITPRAGPAAPDMYGTGMGPTPNYPDRLPEPLVVISPYQKEQPSQRPYEKRGMGLFAAIAAVLAALIAVAALVFVLANRGDDRPTDPNVPTLGGKEPTAVRLRDEGSKIGITWQDPSAGTVSFLVAMGHPGEQLKPVATLGPGQTSYEMGALNNALDYCFTVIAVYRGNQFATSAQTCTDRPAPSTSK